MKHDIKIIIVIIGVVIALVLFFQVKGCIKARNIAKTSKLEGQLEAITAEAEKEKAANLAAIEEMEGEISTLSDVILEKNKVILELQKEDEIIIPTEVIDTPGEGENWEEVAANNAAAAREWETKYYKAQEIIAELGIPISIGADPETGEELFRYPYDSVTYKLNEKYLLAAAQRDRYKQNWETAENLLAIEREVSGNKDKTIARLKLGKTVERIVTIPLSIYGGFKLGQAIFGGK